MTESAESAVSAREILALLPHRFPFLLVDRVLSITEDKIVAVKNVSWGEPYFVGHFPEMPIMPGVLMVEALAQAGGILAARTGGFDIAKHVVFFMAIDKVKFRKPVTPGDQLVMEVVPLRRGRVWKMKGEAKVDGQLVCEAELLATIADRTTAAS
jgi:beta-hydroxyacyl-ACP dehydratase FabZ